MFYEILSKISDWRANDARGTLDWSHLSGSKAIETIDDGLEFSENSRIPSCIVGVTVLFRKRENDRRKT